MSPGLASYVRACWESVEQHLTEVGDTGAVVFLHDAGLLARYADAGGHDLLVRLQRSVGTRRGAHGALAAVHVGVARGHFTA